MLFFLIPIAATPDLELSESSEDLSLAQNLNLNTVFRNDISSTNFGFSSGGQQISTSDYSPEYEYYDDEYEYYYEDEEEQPTETIGKEKS